MENAGLSMELIDSWNLNPLERLGNLAVFEHPGIIWECFLPPFCLMFPLFPTFSACYLSILQRQGWTKLGASSAPRNSPPAPTSGTCHARRNHVAAACLKGSCDCEGIGCNPRWAQCSDWDLMASKNIRFHKISRFFWGWQLADCTFIG